MSPPRSTDFFPPPPRGLKGRTAELSTLSATITATAPARVALIGSGGSGKSMLACALGHRLSGRFGGRLHWFRVGAWDDTTLLEMLALRFGIRRGGASVLPSLRAFLSQEERLLVLDNHEDDHAMAQLLDALDGTPSTVVITARRCLLSGVLIFPVTAPLVTSGRAAFPRVARLTRPLRYNPLALDIADAIVAAGGATVDELAAHLEKKGVRRVRVIDHEDDLPEVSLLVDWAWSRLSPESRRMLGALSHIEGDHVDLPSLASLASRVSPASRAPRTSLASPVPQVSPTSRTRSARVLGDAAGALHALTAWHLVQEPLRGRYAVHAVVRYAVSRRGTLDPRRVFEHYVSLLEAHPNRLALEQTHLFSAMDHAHRTGNLAAMLRVERLLDAL